MVTHAVSLSLMAGVALASANSGGWVHDLEFMWDFPCNLEIVDLGNMMSWEEFTEKYIHKRPVLFRYSEPADRKNRTKFLRNPEKFTKANLVDWIGDYEMLYLDVEADPSNEQPPAPTALKKLLEEGALENSTYMWQMSGPKGGGEIPYIEGLFEKLSEQLLFPPFPELREWVKEEWSKFIQLGSSGTGFGWAQHSGLWLQQIFNRRMWHFYPPEDQPPFQMEGVWSARGYPWHTDILPILKDHKPKYSCVQEENDLMYIPDGWWLLEINAGESLAAAVSPSEDTRYATGSWHRLQSEYRNAGWFDEVIDISLETLSKSPNHHLATLRLADAYKKTGNFSEAREILENALITFPYSVCMKMNLAVLYEEKFPDTKKGVGVDLLRKVLKDDPRQSYAEALLDQLRRGVEVYDPAISARPAEEGDYTGVTGSCGLLNYAAMDKSEADDDQSSEEDGDQQGSPPTAEPDILDDSYEDDMDGYYMSSSPFDDAYTDDDLYDQEGFDEGVFRHPGESEESHKERIEDSRSSRNDSLHAHPQSPPHYDSDERFLDMQQEMQGRINALQKELHEREENYATLEQEFRKLKQLKQDPVDPVGDFKTLEEDFMKLSEEYSETISRMSIESANHKHKIIQQAEEIAKLKAAVKEKTVERKIKTSKSELRRRQR